MPPPVQHSGLYRGQAGVEYVFHHGGPLPQLQQPRRRPRQPQGVGGGGVQVVPVFPDLPLEPGVQRVVAPPLFVLLPVVPAVHQVDPPSQMVEQLAHGPPLPLPGDGLGGTGQNPGEGVRRPVQLGGPGLLQRAQPGQPLPHLSVKGGLGPGRPAVGPAKQQAQESVGQAGKKAVVRHVVGQLVPGEDHALVGGGVQLAPRQTAPGPPQGVGGAPFADPSAPSRPRRQQDGQKSEVILQGEPGQKPVPPAQSVAQPAVGALVAVPPLLAQPLQGGANVAEHLSRPGSARPRWSRNWDSPPPRRSRCRARSGRCWPPRCTAPRSGSRPAGRPPRECSPR